MRLFGLDSPKTPGQRFSPSEWIRIESERRVLWSCFILDSMVGSGVDANLHWKQDFPRIPLPCTEPLYITQVPPRPDEVFTMDAFQVAESIRQMNLRSHMIYLAHLRTQALRYVQGCSELVSEYCLTSYLG